MSTEVYVRIGSRSPDERVRGAVRCVGRALALLTLASTTALAQTQSVAGVIVTEGVQTPVPGAQVRVTGTQLGAVSDAAGRFRINGLAGEQVSLDVRRIGYRPLLRQVRVGDMNLRIELTEKAVDLDEVVVTGTPGATERRALGNAVSQIDADEVTKTAPINSLQDLLNARAAGVVIMPGTGAVGSGSRIRVRGVGSLSLAMEPLIYIDGVRTNNAHATGIANQGFASSTISRFNDINPEDIESIEIIKGPAAATLYGTEASNGVIQIITKKGAQGRTQYGLSIKQGATWFNDPQGRLPVNWEMLPNGTVASIDIVDLEDERGNDIFRTGHLQEYDATVSGGSELLRFFLGGGLERSEGAESNNKLSRWSSRANLSIVPSSKFSANASLSYLDSDNDQSAEAGFGGRMWTTVLATPARLDTPRRGFFSGTPEAYDEHYNFSQGVNRFTGSIQFQHNPIGWFSHRVNAGVDQTREENVFYVPRNDAMTFFFGTEALGTMDVTERNVTYHTLDYSGTATVALPRSITSATSIGAQYYRRFIDSVQASGDVFPAPGLRSVSATTTNRRNSEDEVEDITVGFFVQQQFSWRDRLFVTGAVRADDNSAFGESFDLVYYPKFSVSWILSEEPFFPFDFVDALKLRAAYGESGQQPLTYSALRTYQSATGPDNSAAATSLSIGNSSLGPERGREVELGFDAGLLDDRLGLEFTYYHKRTHDAILDRDVAPSVGFSGHAGGGAGALQTQFINAGEIKNTGIEMLLRGTPIRRDKLGLDLTLSLASNDNELVDLGIPGLTFLPAPGTFLRHVEGHPVGAFWERRIVSADLDANGNAINIMCDDGDGGSVACAQAPFVYLGRTTPDLEGAVSTTLTLWNRLRLYALVDFKRGHHKINGNDRVRCTFTLGNGRCRENFFPLEFDAKKIAAIQSGRTLVDFLIEDASFTKLREVSATYSVPDRYARYLGASSASITLAGRNLKTWTDYNGLEPEAMFLGGSRGGLFGAFEQTILPQLTQFVTTINLTF
ncbi:MAG TPA: TonB-dependent receptor [Gemmatimonadaceae bacterium]|nr:TonB-dependent receptor [Gemmatimonadaceae bacterium]